MADQEQNYCSVCGKEVNADEDLCKACRINFGDEMEEKERQKGKRKKKKINAPGITFVLTNVSLFI